MAFYVKMQYRHHDCIIVEVIKVKRWHAVSNTCRCLFLTCHRQSKPKALCLVHDAGITIIVIPVHESGRPLRPQTALCLHQAMVIILPLVKFPHIIFEQTLSPAARFAISGGENRLCTLSLCSLSLCSLSLTDRLREGVQRGRIPVSEPRPLHPAALALRRCVRLRGPQRRGDLQSG